MRKLIARIFQIIGSLLLLTFLLSVIAGLYFCPPWNCSGGDIIGWFYAFLASFTALPAGLTLLVVGTDLEQKFKNINVDVE